MLITMSIIAKQFEAAVDDAKSKLQMLMEEVRSCMPDNAQISLLRERRGVEFYSILLTKEGLFRGYSLPEGKFLKEMFSDSRYIDIEKVAYEDLFGKGGKLVEIEDLSKICHNLQKGIDKYKIQIEWERYR